MLDQYLSRPGVKPIHFRIASNVKENPRLPPGVRADDMPFTPVVTPPSEGDHDLSSDLGEGQNARAIFDLSEF